MLYKKSVLTAGNFLVRQACGNSYTCKCPIDFMGKSISQRKGQAADSPPIHSEKIKGPGEYSGAILMLSFLLQLSH